MPRRKKHGNNSNINNNNYNILQLQQQQPSKDQDNTVNSTLRMVGLCGNADDAKNNTHTQQVGVINFYCVLFNTQGVLTLQAFSSPIYIDFPTKQVWKNKKNKSTTTRMSMSMSTLYSPLGSLFQARGKL